MSAEDIVLSIQPFYYHMVADRATWLNVAARVSKNVARTICDSLDHCTEERIRIYLTCGERNEIRASGAWR